MAIKICEFANFYVVSSGLTEFYNKVKGKGKVTPKQAYVALRGPGG
jgi:hypothetical protein